jgi:MFS family permease
MLPTLNTVVAECAPRHRRNLALSLLSIGYPLGSTVGGLLAIGVIERFGWQAMFLIGGCMSLAIFMLQLFLLPDSSVIATQRAGGRLLRLVRGARGNLIAVSAAFFLNMICFYFILSWTPKLIEEMGLSAQVGITATVVINMTGLVGGLGYGALADRLGWRRVAQAAFLAFAGLVAVFGLLPPVSALLLLISGLIGVLMSASMTSLYTAAVYAFEAPIRAGGTGLVIGIGRVGATLGPVIAGYALSRGIGHMPLYLMFAACPLLVTLCLQYVRDVDDEDQARPASDLVATT